MNAVSSGGREFTTSVPMAASDLMASIARTTCATPPSSSTACPANFLPVYHADWPACERCPISPTPGCAAAIIDRHVEKNGGTLDSFMEDCQRAMNGGAGFLFEDENCTYF